MINEWWRKYHQVQSAAFIWPPYSYHSSYATEWTNFEEIGGILDCRPKVYTGTCCCGECTFGNCEFSSFEAFIPSVTQDLSNRMNE